MFNFLDFKINWNDINWEKSYNSISAYAQSKIANILFTRELAKRLNGIIYGTNYILLK